MVINERKETFWNRDFIVALLGYFFLFMSVTLFFIFPLFFKQFDTTKSRVGMIMGIHSLMAILIRPFFGRLLDIRGRKKMSLIGIGMLIAVLPLFHLIRDAGTLPLVLRALTGLGWGISMTATMTICSDLAPVEKLAHSMGIVGVAGLISSAVGPLLAEEIVARYGFAGLFNAAAIFLVASFACMLGTRETIRTENNTKQKTPGGRGLFGSISFPAVLIIAALPIIHGAVRSSVVYFIALFGKSIPLDRIGPFFVAFSAAAILTRLGIGDISDKYGRKQVIFPSACIIAANLFLLTQVKSSEMFILAGFIGGFGQGLIFPALSTYIIDILGRENKGFALSLYLTLFDVGMAFGSPFFGWVSDLFGYRWMYFCAGCILFAVTILFTLLAPPPSK